MPTRRHLLKVLGGACAATSLPARAAEFPSGPITFIVSFPAGGSIDVVVRSVAGRLQGQFGKATGVGNRAGAGGCTGRGASTAGARRPTCSTSSNSAPNKRRRIRRDEAMTRGLRPGRAEYGVR